MARPLRFQFGDTEIAISMNKIDRSKLYGFKELEALDKTGYACELATLADDGCTLVGRGGITQAWIDVDGQWCDKAQLSPVDMDQAPITPVPSSFDAPIKLFETATPEEYLQHNIRLVYLVESENDLSELAAELRKGTIFTFPYSYRGGLESDVAFLLTNETDEIMMVVGNSTRSQFIGLQSAVVVEEGELEEDLDSMDFDMI